MSARLRCRSQDERGAVLVIVAVMMVAFLALAALAIDIGSYYQAQRQVQAAADAGALAAAQDLPASAASATTDGTAFALKNYPGSSPTVTVNAAADQVTVNISATTPTFFGKFLGLATEHVGGRAVAGKKSSATPCVTPGNACDAIFAMDSNDPTCTGTGVQFGGGGNTLNGGVVSNGPIGGLGAGGSTFNGPVYYGTSPCPAPTGSNTFNSGQPAAQAPSNTWPIDYRTDFPPCSGAACSGPGGTPSFCTQASTLATWSLLSYYPYTLTSGNIYCGVGTGTASTPSTWNGTIAISATSQIESSFVAGTVTLNAGSSLETCGYSTSGYTASGCSGSVPSPLTANYPVIMAFGTGDAVADTSGGTTLLGDVFAPNGVINFKGGGQGTNFLEAQGVIDGNGGVTATGDGPQTAGGSSSGSEALLQ